MRWPTKDERRWMYRGGAVVTGLVIAVSLCVGGWIVYVRSMHGQMAYEYIQQVVAQQKAAAAPPKTP